VAGVYQFELTVTDNNGAIGKDTVQVTVNAAPNQTLLSNAGTDNVITLPTNTTTLTGNGTVTNGTISSYAWIMVSGPSSGTIATATTATTEVNSLVAGVYQFELTVTDNNGVIGKDTVQVIVNPAPGQALLANAGTDITIAAPTNRATLTGSVTAADGTISRYVWVKVSGPLTGKIASADSATTLLVKLAEGVYQFELTVTDNNGAIGKDTVQVTVNKALKQPPVAKAGSNGTITLPVNSTTLTGKGTDADGTISGSTWVKIAGPSSGTINTANASTTQLNNLTEGIYQYELTVTDNSGAIGKDTVQVTVNAAVIIDQLPIANTGTGVNNELKVYPNPVRDIANLEITTNGKGKMSVSVVDIGGRLVKYYELVNLDKSKIFKLDMSGLLDGYHIITVRFDDGQKISSKVIKYGVK
jgi:Secretion system C-terminal sorting domain